MQRRGGRRRILPSRSLSSVVPSRGVRGPKEDSPNKEDEDDDDDDCWCKNWYLAPTISGLLRGSVGAEVLDLLSHKHTSLVN